MARRPGLRTLARQIVGEFNLFAGGGTVPFHGKHLIVGPAEDAARVVAAAAFHHATAGCHIEEPPFERGAERGSSAEPRHPILIRVASFAFAVVAHDGELIAADPGEQITGLAAGSKALPETREHMVARPVSVIVVDDLQPIEIDEREGHSRRVVG